MVDINDMWDDEEDMLMHGGNAARKHKSKHDDTPLPITETHFTPGPWWFEEDCDELVIVGPRKGCIRNGKNPAWEMCKIDNSCMWDEGKTEFEDRANAELIAAAPDLYAVLEMMTEHYVELAGCGDCGRWDPEKESEVISARSTLSKARGETNG